MSIRTPLIVSLLLVAAMAGLSAWAWTQLPDTAIIAIHFDAGGRPNGYAGKTFALLLSPAIALGLVALFSIIPRIEPRRLNLAASAKLYRAAWISSILITAVAHTVTVLAALRVQLNPAHLLTPALGLMFVVIGNYLGKTRSNFFVGVRTPWTLSSDYSWEKTHRLTGRLFMLAGLAGLVAWLTTNDWLATTVMIWGVIGAALVGVIASYFYWRRDPARHSGDRVPE